MHKSSCRHIAALLCALVFASFAHAQNPAAGAFVTSVAATQTAQAALSISTGPNLGTVTIGTAQILLNATGGSGAYTWSLISGTLPPGLRFGVLPNVSPARIGLTGVATTPGTYSFTAAVSDGATSVSRAFTLKVSALVLKDQYSLPLGYFDQAYSYTFTPLNNAGAVTFTTTSALPAGLTLSSAGILSGTVAAGTYTLNISVTDGVDAVQRQYQLQVQGVHITTAAVLPNGAQNSPYNQTISAAALPARGAAVAVAVGSPVAEQSLSRGRNPHQLFTARLSAPFS